MVPQFHTNHKQWRVKMRLISIASISNTILDSMEVTTYLCVSTEMPMKTNFYEKKN